ncbi:hypothetical protein CCACVL1_01453, partial [Corchorus capsularis]
GQGVKARPLGPNNFHVETTNDDRSRSPTAYLRH